MNRVNRSRMTWLAAALAMLAALLLAAACNGDDAEPTATEEAGTTPTLASTVVRPTLTPEGVAPPTAASSAAEVILCDLVTPEEVEEALGELVVDTRDLGTSSCRYSTGPMTSVSIEQGSQQILEEGIYGEDAPREPVPGIGDEAAWFGEVAPRYLSVRQGGYYFQVRLLLPEVDGATQLEIAKELAAIAVGRIP